MQETVMIWSVLFGGVGLGFFTYGRRQKAVVPLLVGMALFIFPYFVSDVYLLVMIGTALIALPYFVRM